MFFFCHFVYTWMSLVQITFWYKHIFSITRMYPNNFLITFTTLVGFVKYLFDIKYL